MVVYFIIPREQVADWESTVRLLASVLGRGLKPSTRSWDAAIAAVSYILCEDLTDAPDESPYCNVLTFIRSALFFYGDGNNQVGFLCLKGF